jgi:hypothetical protein
VLPILRQRGLFRVEYEHDTLRGNLGLPIRANRHTLARPTGPVSDSGTICPWRPDTRGSATPRGS